MLETIDVNVHVGILGFLNCIHTEGSDEGIEHIWNHDVFYFLPCVYERLYPNHLQGIILNSVRTPEPDLVCQRLKRKIVANSDKNDIILSLIFGFQEKVGFIKRISKRSYFIYFIYSVCPCQ